MRRALREILQTVLLGLLLFAGLQATIQNYRVEGSSMEPTLSSEEYLLVNKLFYYRIDKARLARFIPFLHAKQGEVTYLFHPPRRGDVIVFHYPKDPTRDFVKRVIGMPGETVEIRSGAVYVNGALLEEPYVENLARTTMERIVLRNGQYFVLGDNRPHSNDSKDWGPVPLEDIVGSVWITYWPFSQLRLF